MPFFVSSPLLLLTAFAATLHVEPTSAKPGDAILITAEGAQSQPTGKLGERPLRFYAVEGGYEALTALPLEASPGEIPVMVDVRTGVEQLEQLTATVSVLEPHFPSRELTVAKSFVEPTPAIRRRMKADQKAVQAAYQQPFGPRLFRGPFIKPRDAKMTAPFGDLRTFNGKKQSQHYGLDLDGRVGDPVQAAHGGTVVLVRDCYASGNTILLHHGAGLFTAYFHLSKTLVKAGDEVKQGQRIGAVGKSGRVTGPHLHWGVKIDGLYVDPTELLELTFSAPLVGSQD